MQSVLDTVYNLPTVATVLIGCIFGFLLTAAAEYIRLKRVTKNLMIVISTDICRTIQILHEDRIETILNSEKVDRQVLLNDFYNEKGIYNQIKEKSEYLPRDKVKNIHNFYLTIIEAESLRKSILLEFDEQLKTRANNPSSAGQTHMIMQLKDSMPLQIYIEESNKKISVNYSLLQKKITELANLIPDMEKEYCN